MPLPTASPAGVRRVRKRLSDGSIKVYEYATVSKARTRVTLPVDSIRDLLAESHGVDNAGVQPVWRINGG